MCYPVIVPVFLVVDGGAEVCGREERLAVEGVLWQVAGDGHAVQGAALGPGPVLPAPPAPHTGEGRTVREEQDYNFTHLDPESPTPPWPAPGTR